MHDRPGRPASCAALDAKLAAVLTKTVYKEIIDQHVLTETQFQQENFKLRDREYRYYYAANKDRLPAIPDLGDESGGLSNPTYFNFINYVLWKVASAHLRDEQRGTFTAAVGKSLLEALDSEPLLYNVSYSGERPATQLQLCRSIDHLLSKLQSSGYICGYQLVWGATPGSWPADWMLKGPRLAGDVPAQASADNMKFQVKLHLPADIEGCIALRAEEEGFWGPYVSAMLAHLVTGAGYADVAADEYFVQDDWSGPKNNADALLLLFGDPLQQVDIPWYPTTLVQDWSVGGVAKPAVPV